MEMLLIVFGAVLGLIAGGFAGFIFGRNMWKREWDNSLEITKKFQKMLDDSAK